MDDIIAEGLNLVNSQCLGFILEGQANGDAYPVRGYLVSFIDIDQLDLDKLANPKSQYTLAESAIGNISGDYYRKISFRGRVFRQRLVLNGQEGRARKLLEIQLGQKDGLLKFMFFSEVWMETSQHADLLSAHEQGRGARWAEPCRIGRWLDVEGRAPDAAQERGDSSL